MYKQMIIDDQKETIHRLQQECTEKTNAIIALGERLKVKEQECEKLKQTIAYIKEIAEEEVHTRMLFADKESFCDFNKILQKISEYEVEND